MPFGLRTTCVQRQQVIVPGPRSAWIQKRVSLFQDLADVAIRHYQQRNNDTLLDIEWSCQRIDPDSAKQLEP